MTHIGQTCPILVKDDPYWSSFGVCTGLFDVYSSAATSCAELYSRGLEDNTYATIDTDGSGPARPFTAYCELNGTTGYTIVCMSTDTYALSFSTE